MSDRNPIALRYTGIVVLPGEGVPTPQGWPAANHSEPDAALAKEKAASEWYELAPEPKPDKPAPAGDTIGG